MQVLWRRGYSSLQWGWNILNIINNAGSSSFNSNNMFLRRNLNRKHSRTRRCPAPTSKQFRHHSGWCSWLPNWKRTSSGRVEQSCISTVDWVLTINRSWGRIMSLTTIIINNVNADAVIEIVLGACTGITTSATLMCIVDNTTFSRSCDWYS
jgi:hypothetical protein